MGRPWTWMSTGAGCHAVAGAQCVPAWGVVGAVCGAPVTVTEVLAEVGAATDPCLSCVQLAAFEVGAQAAAGEELAEVSR